MDLLAHAQEFWVMNWFTVVTGVVGIAASWLFTSLYFRKSAQKKQIWYTRQQSPLMRRLIDDFQISYQGQLVKNPYLAQFIVWNSGNVTINGEDIAAAAPLQFQLSSGRFLSGTISKSSKPEIAPITVVTSDAVRLEFDYLDPGDGIVVEIVADSLPNSDMLIELFGTIKGQYKQIKYVRAYRSHQQYLTATAIRYMFILIGIIFVSVAAISLFFGNGLIYYLLEPRTTLSAGPAVVLVTAIYGLILICMSFLVQRKKLPKTLLDADDDDAPKTLGQTARTVATDLLSILR